MKITAITAMALSLTANAQFPKLSNDGYEIQLTPKTVSLPVGIYAMCRYKHLVTPGKNGEKDQLERIAEKPYIQCIALGLTWEDMEPEPGKVSAKRLKECLERVKWASKQAGRKRPLKVLFKPYFYKIPTWMQMSGDVDKTQVTKNSIGMSVIRRPDVIRNGKKHKLYDLPLSTDEVFHGKIKQLMRCVANFLEKYDPEGKLVPMVHYAGPGMTSNQMRPPLHDNKLFPNKGNSSIGPIWSKQKHIDSWVKLTAYMKEFPGFANRCWVFNFTNLALQGGHLSLTTKEQGLVYDALKKIHPDGPKAVICKTESLCVNFDRRFNLNGKGKRGGYVTKNPSPGGRWRSQAFGEPLRRPYVYIMNQKYAHAWEDWAGFNHNRDKRAPSLYPHRELIENSLYLDLDKKVPSKPQGTLWVEVWVQESIAPERVKIFEKTDRDMNTILTDWDKLIRQVLKESLNE